jgi:hypothetical protein
MLRYSLDSLGWYEFEGLIQALLKVKLGLGIEAWGGSGDLGRDAFFEGNLAYPTNQPNPGVFIFQCKFIDSANAAGAMPQKALLSAVRKESIKIASQHRHQPASTAKSTHYILLTNAKLTTKTRTDIIKTIKRALPASHVFCHDGNDICAWLDSSPDVARSFPQLLGLRNLTDLIKQWVNASILTRSQAALEEAQDISRVFVPSAAYNRALDILSQYSFAVLEGPPEVGKTAIGRIIALTQVARQWEAIECRIPDDFLAAYDTDKKQVFIADDFFGRTEYSPARISQWQDDLPHVLRKLDQHHWLILTTRAHLLNMAKQQLDISGHNGKFPDLGEVIVSAGTLSEAERARILYRHTKTSSLPLKVRSTIRSAARKVVRDPHFTPERVRRLIAETLPQHAVHAQSMDDEAASKLIFESIADPTHGMRKSFRALPESHKWLLFSLVEIESVASKSSNRADETESTRQTYERLCPPEQLESFDSVVTNLSEAFVTVYGPSAKEPRLRWVHPSCRDLAIEQLSAEPRLRRRFLDRCSINGLHLASSSGGGASGERSLPLLVTEDDWSIYKTRCQDLRTSCVGILEMNLANYQTAEKKLDVRQKELFKHIIVDVLLPSFKESREETSWTAESLATYYNARALASASTRHPSGLVSLWQETCEYAQEQLDSDWVVYQIGYAVKDLALIARILSDHHLEFFNLPEVHKPWHSALQSIVNRGEEAQWTSLSDYLHVSDSDLVEMHDGYSNLADAYNILFHTPCVPKEAAETIAAAAASFQGVLAEVKEKQIQENSYSISNDVHAPARDVDIDKLFRDV